MERMKLRIKSTIWNTRKEKHSIRTAGRKRIFLKNEEGLRNLWDNFKLTTIQTIGVPEEEEEEQEIEKLFEKKTMKENIPNLVKEIDIQIREAQRIPNKLDPKRAIPRHIIMKMPKVKDKERTLKAAREEETVTYKRVPIRL